MTRLFTFKNRCTTQLLTCIAILAFLISTLKVIAVCGHCTGENYVVRRCEWYTPNGQPPCPTVEGYSCLIEYLPPGVWEGGCHYTYVDAYDCETFKYWGDTTSRRGPCQLDCSCVITDPPFEDSISPLLPLDACRMPRLCVGG